MISAMIGGGVVKILSKSIKFSRIYIYIYIYIERERERERERDQYDNVGGLHWQVCVAQDIYVGKICIACLARLSGDGTLVVHFTFLMTSLISTRHPRDVVRVGV